MSVPFFVSGFGPAVKLPLTPALPKRRTAQRVRGFSLFGVYLRLSITGNCATSLALFNGARINPRCVPSGPITARLPL